MTKFNPENKETLTYGECLGPAMEITEQNDANQYLADYVSYIQKAIDKKPRDDDKTALDVAKINLGYYGGYHSNETRIKVEKLFMTQHPIFGSIEKNRVPTAQEAFDRGLNRK